MNDMHTSVFSQSSAYFKEDMPPPPIKFYSFDVAQSPIQMAMRNDNECENLHLIENTGVIQP